MHRISIYAAVLLAGLAGPAIAQTTGTPAGPPEAVPETTKDMGVPNVEEMMGKVVMDDGGHALGVVHDVILGPEGQAQQLVIARAQDAANPSERLVAVGFDRVRMHSDSKDLHLADVGAAELAGLPPFEYRDGTASLKRKQPDGAAAPR